MTAPDPTAVFREQLWTAIADTVRPLGVDVYVAGPIVDALEPVIRQAVAAELRRLAAAYEQAKIGHDLDGVRMRLRARADELDGES